MPNEISSEGVLKMNSKVIKPAVSSIAAIKRPDVVTQRQELPEKMGQDDADVELHGNKPSPEVIQKNVEHINAKVQNIQRDLQFSVDDESGRTIIRVIDSETKETIRVIPPEDINGIAQRLTDSSGVLFNSIA